MAHSAADAAIANCLCDDTMTSSAVLRTRRDTSLPSARAISRISPEREPSRARLASTLIDFCIERLEVLFSDVAHPEKPRRWTLERPGLDHALLVLDVNEDVDVGISPIHFRQRPGGREALLKSKTPTCCDAPRGRGKGGRAKPTDRASLRIMSLLLRCAIR